MTKEKLVKDVKSILNKQFPGVGFVVKVPNNIEIAITWIDGPDYDQVKDSLNEYDMHNDDIAWGHIPVFYLDLNKYVSNN